MLPCGHDVYLIVFKASSFPKVGQDSFCGRAEGAIGTSKERDSGTVHSKNMGRSHGRIYW
jgi:hypothetical protein